LEAKHLQECTQLQTQINLIKSQNENDKANKLKEQQEYIQKIELKQIKELKKADVNI
jgi:hypothetical protein